MKRSEKDFRDYVKSVRNKLAPYNNGRSVVVLSEYTKKGQAIIDAASKHEGYSLREVYDRWSREKEDAYNDAYNMYCNDSNSNSFGICSHNSFMFTCSWVSDHGVIYLTHKTEYLVVCNE